MTYLLQSEFTVQLPHIEKLSVSIRGNSHRIENPANTADNTGVL